MNDRVAAAYARIPAFSGTAIWITLYTACCIVNSAQRQSAEEIKRTGPQHKNHHQIIIHNDFIII